MYSGIDRQAEWILTRALDEAAAATPDRIWVLSTEGGQLTFGEAAEQTRRSAGFFARLGVRSGDRIAVMMPGGIDFIRVWLGLSRLGAVPVFINCELRGAFLKHQVVQSAVETAVVHSDVLPSLGKLDELGPLLRRIVVAGGGAASVPTGLEPVDFDGWRIAAPYSGEGPRAIDLAGIMFTSGTSGPAKGVMLPHAHCTLFGINAVEATGLAERDRYYISLPLHHVNGLFMQLGATLLARCSAVIRPRFSASEWVPDIGRHGATATNLLGVQAAYLLRQAKTAGDRDHGLRVVVNAPSVPAHEAALRDRFGVKDVMSGYGMTEINIPIWGRLGESRPGAAGWPHEKYFEVVIADPETDRERPRGEAGEILVRPKVPFGFMAGYFNMPDKAVEAWRNLWFHTGDAGIMETDGLVSFVDRIKDCIRRRGENISATEVEAVVEGIEGVAEAAAFAVKSDIAGGEDELMIAAVLQPGAAATAAGIGQRAEALLPRFANPRFVEIVDALPKTSTGKVQREALRKRGTAGALDRAAHADSPRNPDR